MKWLLILVVASLVQSAFKAVITVLVLVLVISLLWGAYRHPRELFSFLGFSLFSHMMTKHPIATLGVSGVLLLLGMVRRAVKLGKDAVGPEAAK